MRITRFLNERGEEHLGVDRGEGTAECLQGSVYAAAGRRMERDARAATKRGPPPACEEAASECD